MQNIAALKKQQIAILEALNVCPKVPLTRKQIAAIAHVDPTKIGDYAGPRSLDQSETTAQKWPFPSLVDLGYVTFDTVDSGGKDVFIYMITEKGTGVLHA